MQAVVLVGGKGTRIQELYPDRPKALAPVAGRPFIEWQLEWMARGGVEHVHLAAGYKADVLQAWIERADLKSQISNLKSRVTLSEEPEPLGTAGGLRYAADFIEGDVFLVCNGDTLLPNLDFQSLEKDHARFSNHWKKTRENFQSLENPPLATLAVTRIGEAGRYGTVEFDGGGTITAFREKGRREEGWINGGVYVMDRALLGHIQPGRNLSLETDIFPALAGRRLLRAFASDPPLLDMGTPQGLETMETYLRTQGLG